MTNGVYVGMPTSAKEIKLVPYKANESVENTVVLAVAGQGMGFHSKMLLLNTIKQCNKEVVVIDFK